MRHFNKAKTLGNPYLAFAITEDINTWYVKIHSVDGDEGEFTSGQYLVKMVLPESFPVDPPEFSVLTPNGVYELGGKVCLSVGEFHAVAAYPSTLGASGFAEQILSGLIGWRTLSEGTRLLRTTADAKRALAASSAAYNTAHHGEILSLFTAQVPR